MMRDENWHPIYRLDLLTGCVGLPSIWKVQESFVHDHPQAKVVGVSEQVTNNWHAQFHIYYKNPGDSLEHEDVWYYFHATEAWVKDSTEIVR